MTVTPTSKRILVLYWHPGPADLRLAIRRHLHVLDWSAAGHEVLYFNALNGAPGWLRAFRWDAIVLHTTLLCLRWSHLFHRWKWQMRWLSDLTCPKVAMPQDEYDHAHVLDDWLFELGVQVICTNFGERHRPLLYPLMSGRAIFRQCLTGYIDESDVGSICGRLADPERRVIDIVYRATHLPFWFGSHGQLKHRIGEEVGRRAHAHGLRADVSTKNEDTIVGPQWLEFLGAGRTVIGSESGSSVLDPRGAIKARIEYLLRAQPDLRFETLNTMMPAGWDRHEFFALSPRHFEAIMTRTCQVLIEGSYDGVLHPHAHYLPVRRDFANLDEVLETIKNRRLVGEISQRAYRDVVDSGRFTYRRLAWQLDEAIQAAADHREIRPGTAFISRTRFSWPVLRLAAQTAEAERLTRYRVAQAILGSPLYWCVIRHPLVCAAKAQLALRLILSSPQVRKLVSIAVTDRMLRKKLRLRDLLLDCFMLRLLQQIHEGRVRGLSGMTLTVDWQGAKRTVIFKSRAISQQATTLRSTMGLHLDAYLAEEGTPEQIVWDHSSIGVDVLYPVFRSKRVTLPIGEDGVYRFRALPLLARNYRRALVLAMASGT